MWNNLIWHVISLSVNNPWIVDCPLVKLVWGICVCMLMLLLFVLLKILDKIVRNLRPCICYKHVHKTMMMRNAGKHLIHKDGFMNIVRACNFCHGFLPLTTCCTVNKIEQSHFLHEYIWWKQGHLFQDNCILSVLEYSIV